MTARKRVRRSASAKKRTVTDKTAQEILKIWTKACVGGLGLGKKFHQDTHDFFDRRLLAVIQAQLDAGEKFDANVEKATKTVARDTGRMCRMLTLGPTVSRDLFQVVFDFLRDQHPACPGGGSGAWCDYE